MGHVKLAPEYVPSPWLPAELERGADALRTPDHPWNAQGIRAENFLPTPVIHKFTMSILQCR